MVSPFISVVLTHFNKGILLQRTIESLQPNSAELLEIIVVDDASTDPKWDDFSLQLEKKYNKVKIIRNSENQGPARRLNQGGNLAQGNYIFFMDADDVLAPQRLQKIVQRMEAQACDLFYGNKIKIHNVNEIAKFPEMQTLTMKNPFNYIVQHNIMEMCVMCSKETWNNSKGCNDSLFIQDESLALQLGYVAKKLLFTETPTVFVLLDPKETKRKRGNNRLSQNLNQQHHDMFFTIYDFLNSHELEIAQQKLLKKKALSTYWKSLKIRQKTSLLEFMYYLLAKYNPLYYWSKRVPHLINYFSNLELVKKPVS